MACNYCQMNRINSEAEEKQLVVTLIHDPELPGESNRNVYLHPKLINMHTELTSLTHKSIKQSVYFRAWLMEIPDKCVC